MVEPKPPDYSPKQGYGQKIPAKEDNNPQSGKRNKRKKKNNRNQNSPGSTPSVMTKFKVRTEYLKGYLFNLRTKQSNMH